MMKKNQSGMTLVEVLATLILLSLIGTLIWTTFFTSAKYNIKETTKLHLQQEANYIITKIQQQHRQLDCYQLEITEDAVELFDCENPKMLIETISSDYKYESVALQKVEPKLKSGDLRLKLTVKDPLKDSKLKVDVETTITRYKSK